MPFRIQTPNLLAAAESLSALNLNDRLLKQLTHDHHYHIGIEKQMASLRNRLNLFDEIDGFDSHPDSGVREWNRSNEEMLQDFGKALYDIILLDTMATEQETFITWN